MRGDRPMLLALLALTAVALVPFAAVVSPVAALGPAQSGAPGQVLHAADSGGASASSGALHGNHVSIDPQVTADGTVIAETAATLTSGFLVLRADDGGRPGEPLGHTYLEGTAFRPDVPVSVDSATFDGWSGNRTLWAVIHIDDGDGEFDPATDQSAVSRYPAAQQSVTLGTGDGATHVLARQFTPLSLRNGSLTVRQVSLAEDGYVVAKPYDGETVVGTQSLSAGSHANVSLGLDEEFVAERGDRFRVRLVAYRDDGDGQFGDGDRPVQVGDETVETDVFVRQVDDGSTTESGPAVITPSPTPTAAEPASPAPTTSATDTATADPTATGTATDGPGFGVVGAVFVFLTVSVVLGRRRFT